MAPAVSVVMPAYNAASTIGAAVTGVLWQQNVDLELLVVDDGSSDETAAIVETMGDERIRLIRQGNAGCGAARNTALAEARGELVALCDADDVLLPGHLDAMVQVQRRLGGIVSPNPWMLRSDGELNRRRVYRKARFPVREDQRRAILEENFVCIMAMFRRDLAERLGGFDESLPAAEDWDFWLRAIYAGARVVDQPRPLALLNRIGESMSTDTAAMEKATRTVLEKAAGRDDLRPDEREYLDRRLAGASPQGHAHDAEEHLMEGRWSDAADAYMATYRLSPRNRHLWIRARALRVAPRIAGPALRRMT